MSFEILYSGSKGNAVIVNDSILIDCGISWKKLAPHASKIRLVLLTHEHGDHFNKRTISKLYDEHPPFV